MDRDLILRIILCINLLGFPLSFVFYYSANTKQLYIYRQKCETKGGVLIQPRDPGYLCISAQSIKVIDLDTDK
jgi:uncharacterized protein with von Willebrand factor type A (vWA) domain